MVARLKKAILFQLWISCFTVAILYSIQLTYGLHFNAVRTVDFEGKNIIFPQEGLVCVLFFFDINSVPHLKVLNDLNFLFMSLGKRDMLKLIAISRGELESFSRAKAKYGTAFDLVNDSRQQIYKDFDYNCLSCIQIMLIDKQGVLRYLSASFDSVFLRDIIQRYLE